MPSSRLNKNTGYSSLAVGKHTGVMTEVTESSCEKVLRGRTPHAPHTNIDTHTYGMPFADADRASLANGMRTSEDCKLSSMTRLSLNKGSPMWAFYSNPTHRDSRKVVERTHVQLDLDHTKQLTAETLTPIFLMLE
ncbi:hypothetical protein ILYODFUR_007194 [Ilyodon furcidens]|uniref:Uncharacterized protein n=1 Tax=Ilyodon furcidens TaxID=33524 RepID=A0ABV0TSN2_9TELE